LRKAGNDVIKVSVLGVQLMDLGPETIDVGGMYHGVISSIPANKCSSSIDRIISKNEPATPAGRAVRSARRGTENNLLFSR
jgi:hypothetical protein